MYALKDTCVFCLIDHPAPQYFLYPSKKLPLSSRSHMKKKQNNNASFEEFKGKDTFFVSRKA